MAVENLNTFGRALAPAMAAVAALTLAGCAATHVGEDWQCPLAQGAHCSSVAAADPAVRGAGPMVRPAAPLAGGGHLAGGGRRQTDATPSAASAENRIPIAEAGTASQAAPTETRRDCPAFCRPFRWFVRLLDSDAGREAEEVSAPPESAPDADASAAASPARADGSAPSRAAEEPPSGSSMRRPETIGRVWIAPYVDANGVYREASWVRIVMAPAAWRRP